MKPICIAGGLLLGTALMAGCTERNTQGPLATTGAGLSADATGATTSAVVDAVGDAVDAPAWLDLASASITRKRSRFYFTVDVAGSIPAEPGSTAVNDPAGVSDPVSVTAAPATGPPLVSVTVPLGSISALTVTGAGSGAGSEHSPFTACWTPASSAGPSC